MKIKKLLSAILAPVCVLAAAPNALQAFAAVEQVPIGYLGDIDGDGAVALSDAELLMQALNTSGVEISEERIQFADMNADYVLDAQDLTILKRTALGLLEPEMLYTEQEIIEERMEAPINKLSPTLLSKGTNHLLMLVVDFPDCKFKRNYTADEIRAVSFGEGNPSSPYYPLESVVGYYERASYGALTMDADIYFCSAPRNIENYVRVYDNNQRYPDTDKLLDDILPILDQEIDYSRYDVNRDGVMDTILLSVADNAPDDGWWPCSGGYYGNRQYDGVTPGNVIEGNSSPSDVTNYNNTWIHELGHGMGLPDYYKYENTWDGAFGLNGDAGLEMMDDAFGDMCAFSKLMYGWYTPSQVHVYSGGTQTYLLSSSQVEGGCIVIPRGDLKDYLSEYMIVEYATPEGNNYRQFRNGGIRVLHCEASVYRSYWGTEFKWENYSEYYDSSNQKQRVLRLANEREGGSFFRSGSIIDGSISGFHWYDSNGYQTVETGVTITVNDLENGMYSVTVSQ